MKITEEALEGKHIGNTIRDGTKYYHIEDIRKYFPYTKYPADKILHIEETAAIRFEDIQEMTEFDKNIYNLMKNKKAP